MVVSGVLKGRLPPKRGQVKAHIFHSVAKEAVELVSKSATAVRAGWSNLLQQAHLVGLFHAISLKARRWCRPSLPRKHSDSGSSLRTTA
ncbi:unnamed protein product [Victoria cruziana]